MNFDSLLSVLLGAGGAGGIGGLITVITAARKGRLQNEETLIARLNADSRTQNERADAAEKALSDMTRLRDQARERAALYRARLVIAGEDMTTLPGLEDLY